MVTRPNDPCMKVFIAASASYKDEGFWSRQRREALRRMQLYNAAVVLPGAG